MTVKILIDTGLNPETYMMVCYSILVAIMVLVYVIADDTEEDLDDDD